MDIQSLLHHYPYNLMVAAIVGALLYGFLCSRTHKKSLKLELEEQATRLSHARREIQAELGNKTDECEQLQSRLVDADQLTQDLSQKAVLLAQEQQLYADLKDRYLNDVGRARDLLKIRADASTELENRFNDSSARYDELHQRWETERKRYAKLVTEKNQIIADVESKLEGMQLPDGQEDDPSLHSYTHGQLESMLVDLRQQVSERDTALQNLREQAEQEPEAPASAETESDSAQPHLRSSAAQLAERDREISRLRGQLLKQSVPQNSNVLAFATNGKEQAEQAPTKAALDAKDDQLAHLRLEIAALRPAATRLRRLESHIQQLAKSGAEPKDKVVLETLELELQQTQSQFLQHQASAELTLERQSQAFQQQLNAKTDTISRLNRQLQDKSS